MAQVNLLHAVQGHFGTMDLAILRKGGYLILEVKIVFATYTVFGTS